MTAATATATATRTVLTISPLPHNLARSRYNQPSNPLMDALRELGRTLMILGALALASGAFLFFGGRLPLRLGRLPGDIVHRGEHTTVYFPIVTSLLLSAAISLIFYAINHFRR